MSTVRQNAQIFQAGPHLASQVESGEKTCVVTGAFSFTGRHIARRLLTTGARVRTLTNHPAREDPFAGRVSAIPYAFDRPAELEQSLRGVSTFYNTYWVRFGYGQITYDRAVENSRILIRAAANAGVRRFVHISITNASPQSGLSYFRGKGDVEEALRESGMSHSILRPTVIFGDGGILIHNIAWPLRRFPIFIVPGNGEYLLQPVAVGDLAGLAVEAGGRKENEVLDAVGPEAFSFDGLVHLVAESIGSRARIVHANPTLALAMARLVGWVVRDVLLTGEEVKGLMAGLLVSTQPPLGKTKLSDWLRQNTSSLGRSYSNELEMHFR